MTIFKSKQYQQAFVYIIFGITVLLQYSILQYSKNMNPAIRVQNTDYLDRGLGQIDLRRIFSAILQDSYIQSSAISKFYKNIVSHTHYIIKLRSYQLKTDQLYCRCSRIENQFHFVKLVDLLISYTTSISKFTVFIIWKSQLNEKFFDAIAQAKFEIQKIIFSDCKVSKSFAFLISKLNLIYLRKVIIRSDRIDNRGLKLFVKLDFFLLDTLIFGNTNITNDVIKTLKKLPGTKLRKWGIQQQQKFNDEELLRNLSFFSQFKLLTENSTQGYSLHLSFNDGNTNVFSCYNFISKVRLEENVTPKFIIYKRYGRINYFGIIPDNVFMCVSKLIDIN